MLDTIGAQTVLAYSIIGLVYALYVCSRVSLDLPKEVDVSALRSFSELVAFSLVFLMCSEKVSFGSKVRPRIFGFMTVGMVWLLILSCKVVLYSAGSGVNRVACDFRGLSLRSLFSVHWYIWSRYGCRLH